MLSTTMTGKMPFAAVGATLAIAFIVNVQPTQAASITTVVNFDDLSGSDFLPSTYGGINWDNWEFYDFDQLPYTPQSPATRIYNSTTIPSFSFNTPVTFNGAYFAGFDFQGVQFELLLGNSQVSVSSILNPTNTPTFLASGYSGFVDQVRVLRSGNTTSTYWVMDDVTYTSGSTPIPTPALLPGLIGLGVAALRKRKAEAAEQANEA